MQTPNTLNITVGTDVILNVTLEHDGVVLNPALIDNLQANLITGLGRKTPLETSTGIDYIVVNIPWVDGRLPGCYSLEITGSINDLAWSAVGKRIIRYTSATEIGRSTVDVDGDHYDVTMEVGYYFTDSPIEGVEVNVDNGVGTPSATPSYMRKVLGIDFHNLKGNGIKSIEQTATSTEDHGVNVVTITDDLDNATNVEIRNGGTGPQGKQGIPGESAVFDPETGEISILAQGLGDSITNPISQKAVTDEFNIDRTWSESVVSSQNSVASDRRYISSDVWKSESTTTQGAIFPVVVGKTYKLIAASGNIYYAFVTAKSTANNDPVSYAGGATGLSSLSNGESVTIVAPSDAVFLYTSRKSSSTDVLPTVKEIETTKEHIASLGASIEELGDNVAELVGENLPTRMETLEESMQGIDESIDDAKIYQEVILSYATWSGTSWQQWISGDEWKSGGLRNNYGAEYYVEPGKTYKMTTNAGYSSNYAFIKEERVVTIEGEDKVAFCEGEELHSITAGATVMVTAPADAYYLYVFHRKKASGADPVYYIKSVSHVIYNKEKIAEQDVTMTNANEILPLLGLTDSEDITSNITWAGNGYVSIDQIVVSSSSITHYSTPIHLAAGDCIIVQTRVNSTLMVLTEDTGETGTSAKYNILVKGVSAPETGNNTYAYIAPRSMNVVVSTFKSSDCLVTIRRKQTDIEANLPEKFYLPPRTYNIIAAYDNLVAIGDSLTKGVVYTLDGSRVASRPFPKVLQKTCGFDNLSIWAEGGKNAEYIWATFSDQFAIPQTGKTLCIVFLGTNGGFTDTLDTEAPVGDEDNWDMTKRVPCYAKIVKTFADFGANILLIKPWTTGTQNVTLADTFATIDGVAERYGCAVIKAGDIKSNNFKYHCYPTYNGVNLLHFNELGYAHFASAIINAVNELPDDNMKFLVPR